MPIKPSLDSGHGRRWQLSRAVTLLKASPLQPAPSQCCSGGNPKFGILDRTMVMLLASFYLLGHHFWSNGLMVVATGELVRINHVDDDMVQRRLGDRHDMMDSEQGGGAFWRHGGVDGRPSKVGA